ncbi:MAG: DUF6268 family outer membrane beta-barrel protein [Cyclobacteriaceae bacterium]
MRAVLTTICLLLIWSIANAQLVDIVRVEYTSVPGVGSDFDFNRKRIAFNYPVKLKNETYLFFGLEYSAIDLNFKDSIPNFDQTKTDEFRLLDMNLTYTYKIDENWRFAARLVPGFSSNLVTNEFLFDDTFISGTMVFIKDKKASTDVSKPYRIIVGVAYSNTSGVVFPIPFLSFYKKFHPKWSYNLGVPTTNIQFHASERFRLKFLGQLDGFTSNLQEGLLVNEERLAERIRMNLVLVGLRYEYKLTHNIEMYLNTTHSIRSRIQLRANRRTFLSFTKRKVFHFTGGIRLKI